MELSISLPSKYIFKRLGDSIEAYTAAQLGFVLNVFDMPVPEQSEKWFGFKMIQIFKGLTGLEDSDLEEWQRAAVEQFYFDNPEAEQGLGLSVWASDLNTVVKTITSIFLDFDEKEKVFMIKPCLYKNPLPWFKIERRNGTIQKVYAPEVNEENPFGCMSLEEYGRITSLYQSYKQGDKSAFGKMCAIYYRPKNHDSQTNDIRIPIEADRVIDERAVFFNKHLSESYKKVIDLHIVSNSVKFAEMYQEIFQTKKTGDGDLIDFVLELSDYDPIKQKQVLNETAHDMFEIACRMIKKRAKEG